MAARGHRRERVQSLILQEVAALVREFMADEIATRITITRVEVTGDLSQAEVCFLVHGGLDPEEAGAALDEVAPQINSELFHRLRMRRVPRLRFVWDRAMEEGLDLSLRLGAGRTGGEEE